MSKKVNEYLGPIHNSHLTAVRRCKRKFHYAFIEGIQPKQPSLPLARGIWLHYCLQAQYLRWGIQDETLLEVPESIQVDGLGKLLLDPENLRFVIFEEDNETKFIDLSAAGMLKLLSEEVYSQLFDKEKEKYVEDGVELPDAVERILEEYFYFWQKKYKERSFKILLVEVEWKREYKEVEFEGRTDYVIRHDNGRIVVGDWKSTKSEPHPEYKFMESQLNLYAWGIAPKLLALGVDKNEIENISVEFNYLSTKLPTKLSKNQDGSLSKRKINTTELTLKRALKEYGMKLSNEKVQELLAKNEREFFSVKSLPRTKRVVKTLLDENLVDALTIEALIETPELVSRTATRNCNWDCDFLDLCKGELYGQNVSNLRKTNYEKRTNTHAGVVEKDE